MNLSELDERAVRLEKDILQLARNTILVHLRFMDIAINRLRDERLDCGALATDGERLCYDRKALFDAYRVGREKVARDCLHILLHCIFRHMYIHAEIHQAAWDLATDIAVENCINELADNAFTCSRQFSQSALIGHFREKLGTLTAERIYRYLVEQEIPEAELQEMRQAVCGDTHLLWYLDSKEEGDEQGGSDAGSQSQGDGNSSGEEKTEQSSDSDKTGEQSDRQSRTSDTSDESSNTEPDKSDLPEDGNDDQKDDTESEGTGENRDSDGNDSADAERDPGSAAEDSEHSENESDAQASDEQESDEEDAAMDRAASPMEKEWRDISDRIRQDLENFSKERGSRAGSLVQNIRSVNREHYDYGAFLRRFASRCEVMRLNDEEFDYLFYTYGLKTYGNMPLVEPLEYKDAKVIREFIVVIDTSGSVQGDLVQKFIQKTYNILLQEESFRKRFVLHILQCDAQVQEDAVIRSREEMESYLENMKIHGLGGTDFRPAFEYVDDLIRQSALRQLKGMLYFTDGYGAFPARKPSYETAFVFLDDNENNMEVPPWAIKLVLRHEDIDG